ncbi:MAG TPA: glycosyltransferase family 2 protein [Nevskia sp.]|nr:glycosyltransferase family 2 protein [Nevskia sp.]
MSGAGLPARPDDGAGPELSVVIPAHNESAGLEPLFAALLPVLNAASPSFEIVIVNDGSADDTLARLLRLQDSIPQLRVIDLSRNFGKEAALTAGLWHCRGACAITIDADLQDPPELIPQMLQKWREGYETVVAVHAERGTDSAPRRLLSRAFYYLLNAVSDMRFVPHAGDFRLLDRAVIEAFLSLPERTRYNKGLFAWVGFRQHLIEHPRPPRAAGQSNFNYRRLLRLAIEAITSFSTVPLRLWTWVGMVIAGISFLYGSFIVIRTLIQGNDVPGYASLIVAVMFFGGINLLSIGVLGEYVGRIFMESKQRPLYVVRKLHEAKPASSAP